MKVGDLIKDKHYPDRLAVIVEINSEEEGLHCLVHALDGSGYHWITKEMLYQNCEALNANW